MSPLHLCLKLAPFEVFPSYLIEVLKHYLSVSGQDGGIDITHLFAKQHQNYN